MKLPYTPIRSFDLAGLLPNVYASPQGPSRTTQKSVLGMIFCHYERYNGKDLNNERRRESYATEAVKLLSTRIPLTVKIFVFNGNPIFGDDDVAEMIKHELTDVAETLVVPYSNDPYKTWHEVAQCDAVFSMRMHGGIFACMAQVPFLQVEYHEKCSSFLDEIGYPVRFRVGDMNVSAEWCADLLEQAIGGDKELKIDTLELSRRSALNFTAVINALSEDNS